MTNRIEIKPGNVVEIFAGDSEIPYLRQPNWPDQTPWADESEARSWAEMFVEAAEVAEAPFAPNGPGQERQPKPTAEQLAAAKARLNFPNAGSL